MTAEKAFWHVDRDSKNDDVPGRSTRLELKPTVEDETTRLDFPEAQQHQPTNQPSIQPTW